MRVISKQEFFDKQEFFVNEIKRGAVFIYPTDTIYGIGCNAIVDAPVQRVREIKNRYTRPFSVIVPGKEWIREYCEMTPEIEEWLDKLPGPYTLILKLKQKGLISEAVNSGGGTIGVRIPDHWCAQLVEKVGYPIVSTSANHVGEEFMTSMDNLASDIGNKMDFIVYEGEIKGRPSRLVNLAVSTPQITER
ncbi:MAG: L-threonylcarbamoyladenylate synthase [Nanoarchaeota archaeon]